MGLVRLCAWTVAASAALAALAVAVTTHAQTRAPRARSRRAFRDAAALPTQPLGVEVLAALRRAREQQGRELEWDARLESSLITVLAYLWRRGRGEKWAGRNGSARYGCSLAQLVIGLSPIMGWPGIPERQNEAALRWFVKRHRKSVQRCLDWLELAGLVAHTPQQDEQGFWWRTIIQLHPTPQLPEELLQEAIERRAGWPERERYREARGRQRNLSAILRRARLSPSGAARPRDCAPPGAGLPCPAPAGPEALRREPRSGDKDTSDASLRSLDSVSEISKKHF